MIFRNSIFILLIKVSYSCCTQSPNMHKVFVYGTLKRNEPNHYWLTSPNNGIGKFITEAYTKQLYPLIIGTRFNIPFLLHSPGVGHQVKGEIYEVDDLMLSKLDELEDHPNFYIREQDEVLTNNNETIRCWIYFLKTFNSQLLKKPFLSDYSSKGDHNLVYMERSQRALYLKDNPDYNARKDTSGDRRAGSYLGQRISLAIQLGNEASVLGTLPAAGSDFGDFLM